MNKQVENVQDLALFLCANSVCSEGDRESCKAEIYFCYECKKQALALLDAGYLLVEPAQLEVLGDEEIRDIQRKYTRFPGDKTDIGEGRAISQATIAHNSKEQLYRRVE